jgi:hypothetical protein
LVIAPTEQLFIDPDFYLIACGVPSGIHRSFGALDVASSVKGLQVVMFGKIKILH